MSRKLLLAAGVVSVIIAVGIGLVMWLLHSSAPQPTSSQSGTTATQVNSIEFQNFSALSARGLPDNRLNEIKKYLKQFFIKEPPVKIVLLENDLFYVSEDDMTFSFEATSTQYAAHATFQANGLLRLQIKDASGIVVFDPGAEGYDQD